MTHKAGDGRVFGTELLSRVEGEGSLRVRVEGNQVAAVELRIFEPPRFFEAMLRGRSFTEPPDITARICGICPIAYQMTACQAIEAVCGVEVTGPLRDLRQLLYCAEWIESHGLHLYLLHAPDFLGVDSGIELARTHRPLVERGLQLKKVGNEILEVVGGRAIHPINVRVGGFYRAPTRGDLAPLRDRLLFARDAAAETVRWVAGFDFPDATVGDDFVGLHHPDEYAVLSGQVRASDGLAIEPASFEHWFVEAHVPHSTALHCRRADGRAYVVGPMARWSLHGDQVRPVAAQLAREVGLERPVRNPFRSIVVRAVEILHACDLALELIDRYEVPDAPAIDVEPTAGVGYACTEAPRGLLYHRYVLEADGTIAEARIVPPTSQNQSHIEGALQGYVADRLDRDDHTLAHECEALIRSYDPCISCATHFLDLEVDRR